MIGQQKKDIGVLEQKKSEIRQNAERLAEKYDDAYERQEILFKRAMEIVQAATSAMPHMLASEKDFANQIKSINANVQAIQKKVNYVKDKVENGEIPTRGWSSRNAAGKAMILPTKQEEIIRDAITDM